MSESLRSPASWNGGAQLLSFKRLLSECGASEPDTGFPDESRNPFLRFLVMGSLPSGAGGRLLAPGPCNTPSLRWSLQNVLGSLNPILGLLSLSGWFSLGFREDSLGTLLVSQPESLKALLGSFKSLGALTFWSLEGLWSLGKLLLLVVEEVVRRVKPLPLEPSC